MALEVGDEERAPRRDPHLLRPRVGDDAAHEGAGDAAATEGLGNLGVDGDEAIADAAVVDPAGELATQPRLVAVGSRGVFDRQVVGLRSRSVHSPTIPDLAPAAPAGQAGGSGCSISGTNGWPVISLEPRPWVKKLHAQRTTTTSRLANPIR